MIEGRLDNYYTLTNAIHGRDMTIQYLNNHTFYPTISMFYAGETDNDGLPVDPDHRKQFI